MLGKLKVLLKIVIALVLLAVILFGIYRREYLSQAIPVYMQYLEQRDKWEHINTGNYVFLYAGDGMRMQYFIIKNNELYRYFLYGNPKELKFLAKPTKYSHLSWFMKKKGYRIKVKFNMIQDSLIEKLFDTLPWKDNRQDRYIYTIAYDREYGYPKMLKIDRENNKEKITLGISFPYVEFVVDELIVLPQDFKFTKQEMEGIMKRYEFSRKDIFFNDSKIIEKRGGNLIQSGIFKPYKMPMVVDVNVSK